MKLILRQEAFSMQYGYDTRCPHDKCRAKIVIPPRTWEDDKVLSCGTCGQSYALSSEGLSTYLNKVYDKVEGYALNCLSVAMRPAKRELKAYANAAEDDEVEVKVASGSDREVDKEALALHQAGLTDQEVAEELNRQGYKIRGGKMYQAKHARWAIERAQGSKH